MSVLYLDISGLATSGLWFWHSTCRWDTCVYCVKFSFCLWPHQHLGSYRLLSSHIINITQSCVLFSSCSLDTFSSGEFIFQFHFGIVLVMNVYLVSFDRILEWIVFHRILYFPIFAFICMCIPVTINCIFIVIRILEG